MNLAVAHGCRVVHGCRDLALNLGRLHLNFHRLAQNYHSNQMFDQNLEWNPAHHRQNYHLKEMTAGPDQKQAH